MAARITQATNLVKAVKTKRTDKGWPPLGAMKIKIID